MAVCLVLAGGWLLFSKRRPPEEMERGRRAYVTVRGRITEAEITEVQGHIICYSYYVGGVCYHVVQDVSRFAQVLPRDTSLLPGPVLVRYLPGNPANSIVISEQWSGIRPVAPPG
jgi:hypothetical protein